MSEVTEERRDRETPQSLRLREIVPSMTVNDLAASIAWYCDTVGFTLGETMENEGKMVFAQILAGSTKILLGQDDGAKGWDRQKGVAQRLHLSTAQDVDQLASDIKARGGTLESEPADMPWGVRAFSLVDPDGFAMTISTES